MTRIYLVCLIAIAFFGAIAAGLASSPPALEKGTSEKLHILEPEPKAAATEPGQVDNLTGADAVVLDRQSDGHFYADVKVNNMPVHMIVDTGASGIALSREDARKAGLAVSAGMFEVVGQGASGDVRGETAMLDSVALGQEVVTKVPAIVLDSGSQSLLGQSFLQQFESVEIKGDKMILR